MKRAGGRGATGVMRGATWSLLGQLVPAAVGFVLVPRIVSGFGDARFGLLSLAWAVIGYLSFLDLGISRAVTRSVATSLALGRAHEVRVQTWSAITLMLAIGIAACALLYPFAPWIAAHALALPPELAVEATRVVQLLCIGLPITLLMNALRGVLEAYQEFGLVNVVRLPFGVATFVIPWLTLPHTRAIAVVIAWLMVARLLSVVAYALMCVRVMGQHARPRRPTVAAVRELVGFGAWITVSNVVSPLMVSFDRFVIGGLLSVALVTYYVTPYQIATQFLIVPMAAATVLFPRFAARWESERAGVGDMYLRAIALVFAAMFAAAAVVVAVAPELLGAWLGARFAGPSAGPLRWLMVGVMMNGIAHVPFTFVQGAGRSDWTAKLHLVEAPLYAAGLVWAVRHHGLTGVAVAWSVRTTVDLLVLYALAARLSHVPARVGAMHAVSIALALGVLALITWPAGFPARATIALGAMAACAVVAQRQLADRLRAWRANGGPGTPMLAP